MKKVLFFIIPIFIGITSCSKDDNEEYRCESGNPHIIGAMCNDGSKSNATAQGACSSHGGVSYWLCKD